MDWRVHGLKGAITEKPLQLFGKNSGTLDLSLHSLQLLSARDVQPPAICHVLQTVHCGAVVVEDPSGGRGQRQLGGALV